MEQQESDSFCMDGIDQTFFSAHARLNIRSKRALSEGVCFCDIAHWLNRVATSNTERNFIGLAAGKSILAGQSLDEGFCRGRPRHLTLTKTPHTIFSGTEE